MPNGCWESGNYILSAIWKAALSRGPASCEDFDYVDKDTFVEVARHLGLCQEEVVRRQRELIKRAGLPYSLPSLSFSELWASMLHDKKVSQGTVYCVLPKRIGKVAVVALEKNSVKEWFSGLNKSKVTH